MPNRREVPESPEVMGKDEEFSFQLDTTSAGGSPSSASCTLYDMTREPYRDVSATLLIGEVSVDGDYITSPTVKDLVPGHIYRLNFVFTSGGNVHSPYLMIEGEV